MRGNERKRKLELPEIHRRIHLVAYNPPILYSSVRAILKTIGNGELNMNCHLWLLDLETQDRLERSHTGFAVECLTILATGSYLVVFLGLDIHHQTILRRLELLESNENNNRYSVCAFILSLSGCRRALTPRYLIKQPSYFLLSAGKNMVKKGSAVCVEPI